MTSEPTDLRRGDHAQQQQDEAAARAIARPARAVPATLPDEGHGPEPSPEHALAKAPMALGTPAPGAAEAAFTDVGADDLLGTTLVKTYAVERVIGEGGMGRVYEARHTRIAGKRFAIKVLHPEYLRQPEVVARFQREAEAAASIRNPHVVGVYDVDRSSDGRPFMVTELLDGRELGSLIDERGPLPVGLAVRIVRQVCRALGAAHRIGVVHRDIKPANIFLTGEATAPFAKVLDFGISRIAGQGGASLTKTGMIMGTPAFMAPEQARGTAVDHRVDIYSLGAVLHTALTGRDPFEETEPQAALVAVLTKEPVWPRAIDPAIPEHLELVVQRAMAKSPADRYQSMEELERALAPFDPSGAQDAAEATSGTAGVLATAATWPGTTLAARSTVSLARPELVLLVTLGAVGLYAALLDGVGALLRIARPETVSSGLDTALVGLVLACVLATPGGLLIRHLRRKVWRNSAQVLAFSRAWRLPVAAAFVAYGLAALLVRVANTELLGAPAALGWPGWDLALFVVGVGGAALAAWAQAAPRATSGTTDPVRRPIVAVVAGSLGSATMVVAALLVQPAASTEVASGASAPSDEPRPTDGDAPSGDGELASSSPAAQSQASTGELETARAAGLAGLETLREKYPKDAGVLRAIVLEVARRRDQWPRALELAGELFVLSPTMVDDDAVSHFVRQAVDGPTEVGKAALELAARKMGKRGPDILYDVWISGKPRAKDAEDWLRTPPVRQLFTPALGIAVELREAAGCSGKRKLLERAAALGDERTIDILEPLVTTKSRGCGILGLGSCPAPCQADAAAMKKTIAAIRESRKR